jgi:hypothetical protein
LSHKGYKDLWTKYNIFDYNKPKHKDIFEKYERQISAINSKVSMLTHWWVIQNIELINQNNEAQLWELIWYEDVVKDTEGMMEFFFEEYKINKSIKEVNPLHCSATTNAIKSSSNTDSEAVLKEVVSVLEKYEITEK